MGAYMTEEEYWYWLINIKGMWHGKIKKLIDIFGTPEEIYNASDTDLKNVHRLKEEDIFLLKESKDNIKAVKELDAMSKKGIRFVHYGHKDYPQRLKNIYDYPYGLFVRGQLPKDEHPTAAIIGTRQCTNYGREIAKKIAEELSLYGVGIVSGLAKGIDSAAHMGTVESGGAAYAVMGCGVDICYPRENIELFCKCIECGGIISEFPPGTRPAPWQFPQRNRIISGLSDIIIVVEAKEKSGSLITVESALEQGKDVFAVPGRLGDVMSTGCNMLIKAGACIITDIKEILNDIGINTQSENDFIIKNEFTLEKDLQVVYSCLDLLPKSLDQIAEETGYSITNIMQIIIKLQFMDLVTEPMKNHYAKKM